MTKLLTQRISFTMNFYRFFKTIWNKKNLYPPLVTPLHKNAPTPTRQTRLLGIPKTHRTYPGSMGHGNFNYQNGLGTRTIRNNLLKTLNLYFAQLSTAGLIIKKRINWFKVGDPTLITGTRILTNFACCTIPNIGGSFENGRVPSFGSPKFGT